MDDLEKYIAKRKQRSREFARTFEVGYENFKIGYLLRQTSEEMGNQQQATSDDQPPVNFLLIMDGFSVTFKSNKLRGEYGSNNDASAGGVGE